MMWSVMIFTTNDMTLYINSKSIFTDFQVSTLSSTNSKIFSHPSIVIVSRTSDSIMKGTAALHSPESNRKETAVLQTLKLITKK